jgi:hypothetical protein
MLKVLGRPRASRQASRAGQPQVDVPAGKRVHVQVIAFARAERLHQHRAGRGNARQARLRLQHRPRRLQFGLEEVALRRPLHHLQHGVAQLGGQRHLAALPRGHGALVARGLAHIRRHLAHPHEFEQLAGEEEAVALAQPRDEALLDRADVGAAQVLHLHSRIADDGANPQAMALRDAAVRHAVNAFFIRRDAVIVGVRGEALAASLAEGQCPVELLACELAIRPRRAHFLEQLVGAKATPQRDGDEMLDQHVQRLAGRLPLFDPALLRGVACGRRFDDLHGVGWHQGHAAGAPRRVAAAARALHHPGDALGRADLQHALDRKEVHA